MLKSSLEKFDTPIVIINQEFEGEDWSVITNYIGKKDVLASEDKSNLLDVGWHVSITLPNLDDVELPQVFSTPEAALEYGIRQILSGRLKPVSLSVISGKQDEENTFGRYHSVA